LQSVDRMVRKVVDTLSADGVLDNTYIIFTCDNGYLLGEHDMEGKNMPYEEDMQIPFLIRGPGIPDGPVNKTMNLVDIPPTIEQITGATPGRPQDGKSIIPVINGGDGYNATLIQAGSSTEPWSYRGMRDGQWTYVEHSDGTEELYDRNADPFELTNLAGQRPEVEADFKARLAILENCAGSACQNG
jgi:N-acetylglucosamine-6-sulfatase